MTLQEFYDRIGGDYKATISRLPSEALIKKFVLKYPGDPSFEQLRAALDAQDWELAFRASHTLKGVAANLGLERLRALASDMTECLRRGELSGAQARLAETKTAYRRVLAALEELE